MAVNVKSFAPYGFWANSYAIEYKDNIALVDIGCLTQEIENYVIENKGNIKYILLTHCHFDHICGVEKLRELVDARVIVHKDDKSGLNDEKYSLCGNFQISQPNIKNIETISNGDKITFGDKIINVMHTPGHTQGSVCYIIDDVMLSGDTLFQGSIGRTDFITGNVSKMMESLNKIKELKVDYKIYSGHGESTTLFAELQNNPYLNL